MGLSKRNIFHVLIFIHVVFALNYILFAESIIPNKYLIVAYCYILIFFFLKDLLFDKFKDLSKKRFSISILIISLFLRLSITIILYYYFLDENKIPFEYNAVDSLTYHKNGMYLSHHFLNENFNVSLLLNEIPFSDRGFNILIGWLYMHNGQSILLTRIIFSIFSAFSILLLYRIVSHVYNEKAGKYGCVLMLLMPNFSLYLGTHLKETFLIFIVLLFLDQSIRFIVNEKNHIINLLTIVSSILILFLLRTALGATAIISLFGYLISSSSLYRNYRKLITIFAVILSTIIIIYNSEIGNEISTYIEKSKSAVSENMNYRAERSDGNKFAIYAGAPLFLSIIFIAPFPSFVFVKGQEFIWLFASGNMIKNILAFFLFIGIFKVCKFSFQKSSLLIYFFFVYLLILANSGFAISERFHLPILPIFLGFSSIGIIEYQKINNKYYFIIYLILISALILSWNYIKLSGRL
jgi:hypothetical protein